MGLKPTESEDKFSLVMKALFGPVMRTQGSEIDQLSWPCNTVYYENFYIFFRERKSASIFVHENEIKNHTGLDTRTCGSAERADCNETIAIFKLLSSDKNCNDCNLKYNNGSRKAQGTVTDWLLVTWTFKHGASYNGCFLEHTTVTSNTSQPLF
jgi:hypothetical protein